MKFSKVIYVTKEHEGEGNEYLSFHSKPEDAAEVGVEKQVGVYELTQVLQVETDIQIVTVNAAKPSRG